jgi:hypothetical protein
MSRQSQIRAAKARHAAVFELEPELAAVYASQFRKVAAHAADRFESLATPKAIAAAADGPPGWVPPDPNELVDAVADDAAAAAAASKIHLEAIQRATPKDIGIDLDVASPYAAGLLAKVGTKSINMGLAVRDAIAKTIGQAYAQGLSVPNTAAALRDSIDHLSTTTAIMQARTDLIGLANGASLASAQSLGDQAPQFKEWLATDDERTRETHADADGQVVPIDQPFQVGDDLLMYPGDPDGSDEEVINCRCTLIYTDSAGNEEGNMDDALTAAVSGSTDLPLSERARAWDAGAATARVKRWASSDGSGDPDKINYTKLGQAYFWQDAAGDGGPKIGDFKLPFADIIGGKLTAVFRGVTAAAGRLSSTQGIDRDAVEGRIRGYYSKAAKAYNDPTIKAPFAASGCANCDHPFSEHLGSDGPCTMDDCPCTSWSAKSYTVEVGLLAAIVPGQPTPWRAILCVEGEETADGRFIDPGAVTWRELPLSLMAQWVTEEGHDGAELAGRIDRIWKDPAVFTDGRIAVMGEGIFNPDETGQMVATQVENQSLRGVSVDMGAVEVTIRPADSPPGEGDELDIEDLLDPDANYVRAYTKALILGATVCPFQAIGSATIEVLAAVDGEVEFLERIGTRTPGFDQGFVDGAVLVASAAPLAPPAEWFQDPQLDGPTPFTITDDGRVFGHAALWGVCHVGNPQGRGVCTTAPRSTPGYPYFHLGELETQEGDRIAVGTVTMDTGHAPLKGSRMDAARHYDDTGTAAAHVRAGEDAFGIWIAGALVPDLSAADVRRMRAAKISGDWRGVNGRSEMIAALEVNVPGFPVPRPALRASGAGGEVLALVAAGIVGELPETEQRVRARAQALAARTLGTEALLELALGKDDAAIVASAMRITVEVDQPEAELAVTQTEPPAIAPTLPAQPEPSNADELDREVALQSDYTRTHGFFSQESLSGADITRGQLIAAQQAASALLTDPDALTSQALRDRLLAKGYLIGARA